MQRSAGTIENRHKIIPVAYQFDHGSDISVASRWFDMANLGLLWRGTVLSTLSLLTGIPLFRSNGPSLLEFEPRTAGAGRIPGREVL